MILVIRGRSRATEAMVVRKLAKMDPQSNAAAVAVMPSLLSAGVPKLTTDRRALGGSLEMAHLARQKESVPIDSYKQLSTKINNIYRIMVKEYRNRNKCSLIRLNVLS